MTDVRARLRDMVVSADLDAIRAETQQALDAGADAEGLVEYGLSAGMQIVGHQFKAGELFLPEVLRSAKTMDAALEILSPVLTDANEHRAGTVVIGTVEGDIHSIGKDLVAMVLQGAGYRVINLGVDVKPERFVEAAREHTPDIVAMSALLTTTMPMLGQTIGALSEAGLRDRLKVIVGGAPVTGEYATAVTADAFARNAGEAVDVVGGLLG
jgi:5-methyltetrahydrofolate--homocysteine methyltransferase